MNLFLWNCLGLGGTLKVRSLCRLVRSYSPNDLFLMETKANSQKLQRIGNSLAFENSFFIGKDSGGEGLALFWSDYMN